MVTWGTTPGMVVQVTDSGSGPGRGWTRRQSAESAERALQYMGLEAGTPIERDPAGAGLHRLLHELADLRPARGAGSDQGPQGR